MDSILTSIKQLLGLTEDYEVFDSQIVIYINAAFAILSQIGVGPKTPFFITDKAATWNEFNETGDLAPTVKEYIYLKVRQVFDPPTNSFTQEMIQKQISELEWRLYVDNDGTVEEEPTTDVEGV